ncbi:MAG: hypothetical protein EU549_05065 [Promethearchaeota archaeon]|nr:MAG: hypothetical protein EU549_05065 [Candidatus Lokiarchaeota archaeon]
MTLWKKVAAIQIKQKTYFIRKNRKILLLIIFGILFYWAFYLGPNLFDIIIPNDIEQEASQYLSNITLFVEYFISSLFLVMFIYPFYDLYKEQDNGSNFFIRSSPIKPGDILIGEFLGDLIIHSAIILLIGPVLISIILQITALNIFQYIIIYSTFFGLFILSLLLGTIFAKIIQMKMRQGIKSQGNKGSYVCFIFLGILIFFSLFRFFMKLYSDNPFFRSLLLIYPPSWYSNILLYSLDLISTNSYFFGIWPNLLLAINVPILIFYVAYKYADKFYLLRDVKGNNLKEKRKNIKFNKIIPFRQSENLILTQFKIFFRNKENFIRIISVFIYNFFLSIIILISIKTSTIEFVEDVLSSKILIILLISWLEGLIFGSILGMNNFLYSKNLVFRYKKSPKGLKSLILSYLFLFFTIMIVVGLVSSIFNTFIFQFNLGEISLFYLFFSINGIVIFIQIMSLQCIHPFFKEQETNIHFLIYLVGLFQVFSFIIALCIWIPFFPYTIRYITPYDFYKGLSKIIFTHLIVSLIITGILSILGLKYINPLE